jgi:ATP-dependent RNA helicase RhlE
MRTKHGANKLTKNLMRDGYRADAIHGNKSQSARQRALESFRTGHAPILVATDVAARGIDVKNISLVVNYDLPHEPEAYVHRIGRTARAGTEGQAIAFCEPGDRSNLRAIQHMIRKAIPVVKIAVTPQEKPAVPVPATAAHAPRPAHTEHHRAPAHRPSASHPGHAPRTEHTPRRDHAPRSEHHARGQYAPRANTHAPRAEHGRMEHTPRTSHPPRTEHARAEHGARAPHAPGGHSQRPHAGNRSFFQRQRRGGTFRSGWQP